MFARRPFPWQPYSRGQESKPPEGRYGETHMIQFKSQSGRLAWMASASLVVLAAPSAQAQYAVKVFNIQAQPATSALPLFAKQSDIQVLAPAEALAGVQTNAVSGEMSIREGVSRLLQGSGLKVKSSSDRTILISRSEPGTAAPKNVAAAATDSVAQDPAPVEAEPETIVVTGLRGALKSARQLKRDSDSISDSVVAQDIGKLPDQNIAEAAQRIPGVQLQRYKEEGAGIAIRGLKQTKIVLDGRDVFGSSAHAGEYNGRSFDLQDLPAEVLAGVDVAKTSSANEIEGGLGGYVNIRTRKPFDFKGFKGSVSAKLTSYDMAGGFGNDEKAQFSALLSNRWLTSAGEVGLLVNVAHTESLFGTAENEIQRTQQIANYAGSGKTVTLPTGMFTGVGHHGKRFRDTYVAAFQWRPNSDMLFYVDALSLDLSHEDVFQTARFNVGTPTSTFALWDGSNNLKSGTFTNNTLTDAAAYGDEFRKTKLIAAGGAWTPNLNLTIKGEISRTETEAVNTLDEWGIAANIPTLSLTINQGSPSHLTVSGIDLKNKAAYKPSYLLAINLNGDQENTAARMEATYRFSDSWLRSIETGFRRSDYTRHSYGFVNFFCIQGCGAGAQTLADLPADFLYLTPAAQSPEVGAYYTFSEGALRAPGKLRTFFGLPSDQYTSDQDQLNNEKTSAAFLRVNYGFSAFGRPVQGNIGVRVLKTDLHGESYGRDASGTLVLQSKDSRRTDTLPSFNVKIELAEQLFLRIGASKTLGPVNFQYLSAATNISNQVQKDAQRGNPDLKPYTSKNLDASIEHYFDDTGMVYLGLFHKTVDGFIQTTAVQEQINGDTYNVSTYTQAGESTIKGLEVGYQKFFDTLPAPFDGLGLQANYTYVDSLAPSSVAGKTVPLEGLSKHSYNIVGMYEKGAIKARVAYNYRNDFVVTTSSSGAQGVPIYAAELGTLDASLSYDVTEQLSVVLDAVNLTGEATEQYYGNPQNQMNYLPINKRVGIQVRYSF